MGKYRKVDTRLWNDEKFSALSDAGKLAFLFVLTHPHMTALGAMRATIPGLAAELGWETKAFREAFAEALREGMIEHCEKVCFVALPNFLRYNPPESPNVVKSWPKASDLLPECDAKLLCLQRAKGYAEGLGKAFGEAFAKAMPYPKPKPKQEQEQEPNPKRGPDSRERARDFSDSDSRTERAKAQIRFIAAVAPLIGLVGGRQLPRGSKQGLADETCVKQWWADVIWPADDGDVSACRSRTKTFLGWCAKAPDRDKPMAWLTKMMERLR